MRLDKYHGLFLLRDRRNRRPRAGVGTSVLGSWLLGVLEDRVQRLPANQSDRIVESDSCLGERLRLGPGVKKQSEAMNRFSLSSSPAYRTVELVFPVRLTASHYANRVDRTYTSCLAGSAVARVLLRWSVRWSTG